MGLSQSNMAGSRCIDISDYTIVEKRSNGLILINPSTQARYFLRDITAVDKRHHDQLMRDLDLHNLRTFKHILNLVSVEKQAAHSFCSSTFRISTIVEFATRNLLDEIKARSAPFSLLELLDLIAWLVEASVEATATSIFVIMPKRIHIMRDGSLKLRSCSLEDPEELDMEQYFSPQRFQGSTWNRAQSPHSLDRGKQLVFGIGLTAMAAALLEDSMDCYDFKASSLRVSLIEEKLQRCCQSYPPKLAVILGRALEFDPESRLSLLELGECVRVTLRGVNFTHQVRSPTIDDLSSIRRDRERVEVTHKTGSTLSVKERSIEGHVEADDGRKQCLVDRTNTGSSKNTLKQQSTYSNNATEYEICSMDQSIDFGWPTNQKNNQKGYHAYSVRHYSLNQTSHAVLEQGNQFTHFAKKPSTQRQRDRPRLHALGGHSKGSSATAEYCAYTSAFEVDRHLQRGISQNSWVAEESSSALTGRRQPQRRIRKAAFKNSVGYRGAAQANRLGEGIS